MNKNLNWILKNLFNLNRPFLLVATLCFLTFLFIQASSKQSNNVISKTKSILVDGAMKAFISLHRVGSSFPCGEEMAIAVEDLGRYIFSAQSGWLATLLPGTNTHIIPPAGQGWEKRSGKADMNLEAAYNRTKNLNIGYFEGMHGLRWAITDEQAIEFYDQVHAVNIGGEEFTAFDHNNMFYEGLISTQILVQKTEAQASLIEQQAETIERLKGRLNNIENALNIHSEFIPLKILGEVHIYPNPISDSTLQVAYQINSNTTDVQLTITDLQGKKVYENRLNAVQKKGNQNLQINLPAGTYLYYLENGIQQTNAKKLMIQ